MVNQQENGFNAASNGNGTAASQLLLGNGKRAENEILEDTITELNEVAFLSASKLSLRQQAENGLSSDETATTIKNYKLRGYIYALLSALCTAVTAVLIKNAKTLSGGDAGVIRYFVQFLVMFVILKYKKLQLFGPKKQRTILIIRSILGTTGLIGFLFAYKLLHPSDSSAILHSSVIIISILARIFLKEKLTTTHFFALFFTATGVLFISKPKAIFGRSVLKSPIIFNETSINGSNLTLNLEISNSSDESFNITLGVLFALMGALSLGIVQLFLKKLSMFKVHYSVVTIYTTYIGFPSIVLLSVGMILAGLAHTNFQQEIPRLPMDIFYGTLSALVSVCGQITLNLSIKYEEASKVAIIKTMDVFIAFILQYFLLNIKVDMLSLAGCVSIVFGTFLVLFFKLVEDRIGERAKLSNNIFIKCLTFKV